MGCILSVCLSERCPSPQWWWTTRAYLDSSLTRISSYTFAAAINASSLARRFFVTKASFHTGGPGRRQV